MHDLKMGKLKKNSYDMHDWNNTRQERTFCIKNLTYWKLYFLKYCIMLVCFFFESSVALQWINSVVCIWIKFRQMCHSQYFRQNISLNRNILHWLFWLCSQKGVSDADSEYFVKSSLKCIEQIRSQLEFR